MCSSCWLRCYHQRLSLSVGKPFFARLAAEFADNIMGSTRSLRALPWDNNKVLFQLVWMQHILVPSVAKYNRGMLPGGTNPGAGGGKLNSQGRRPSQPPEAAIRWLFMRRANKSSSMEGFPR